MVFSVHPIAIAFCLGSITVSGARGESSREPLSPAQAWLKDQGISTDPKSLADILRQSCPDDSIQQRIDRLIQQLGSRRFSVREKAMKELAKIGQPAKAALLAAIQSEDLETARRARKLVTALTKTNNPEKERQTLLAALALLAEQESGSTGLLLSLIRHFKTGDVHDAACEALWASVKKQDESWLRKAIKEDTPTAQAAAIVALEVVLGNPGAPKEEWLDHKDETLQLAAARALIPHAPRPAFTALTDLILSRSPPVSEEAIRLLERLTDHAVSGLPRKQRELWRQWLKNHPKALTLSTKERLRCCYLRLDFFEGFTKDAEAIPKKYGPMYYEHTVNSKAMVKHSLLYLDGHHAEGDQRLAIDPKAIWNQKELPAEWTITVGIGGQAEGSGLWHVGTSIGNIRILFHPHWPGGGFRAEQISPQQYLMSNVNMGFTPKSNRIHTMTIQGRRVGEGAEFNVTFEECDTKKVFKRTIRASRQQLKSWDRIALERSGRRGGAALFDSILIQTRR